MSKHFNINGILTDEPTDISVVFEWSKNFSVKSKDNMTEIDFKLISLPHKVADKLFGSIQNLYGILAFKSTVYSYGGVDAEIKVSKQEFDFVNYETFTHKVTVFNQKLCPAI